MIHLRRKREDEEQGDVFMAITNNIGHDDHQKDTPARNNFPAVAKYFAEWQKNGKIAPLIINNEHPDEPLGCPLQIFTVPAKELNFARLDAFYYSPELKQAKKQILDLYKAGKIELKKGSDFTIIPTLKQQEIKDLQGKVLKYIEIGNVTIDGQIISFREDYFENLPTRGRLRVQKNDVVFAKNNSSRGTTVLIPEWYSGNLVTTGFIGIRPKDYNEALILWSVLESEFFRKQVYYYAITASQPEIRENIFLSEMIIPYPKSDSQKKRLIDKANAVDKVRNDLQKTLSQAKEAVNATFFADV
jgi:type I restriction enzyme M protein